MHSVLTARLARTRRADHRARGARQRSGGRPVSLYCGFDPTAASLHVGHLTQVLTMRRLQLAGHHPYALVGGATGLIGDPRMSGERVLNDAEIVSTWVESLRGQISRFLDLEGEYGVTMVNNLDWIGQMSALDFLRDMGKHFRMGTMLAKDTVARRLQSDEGISYTEFSYQVLQGIDYLELHRRHGVTLQYGGNDQWGNLLSGVDLIHKVEGHDVHALTTPLVTKADGSKFGKSEGGAVWLDAELTSPYAFHQFWLNAADADVLNYLRFFTFRSREEIAELEHATETASHQRAARRLWPTTSPRWCTASRRPPRPRPPRRCCSAGGTCASWKSRPCSPSPVSSPGRRSPRPPCWWMRSATPASPPPRGRHGAMPRAEASP